MTYPAKQSPVLSAASATQVPALAANELRRLSHDLSNALEVIVQTSYLLSTVPLQPPAAEWRGLLEQGVQQAVQLNQELRDYIRANSLE